MINLKNTAFALIACSTSIFAAQQNANQAQPAAQKMPAQSQVPNPSARWGVTDGCNLFITGEALVMKFGQDNAPFAYTTNAVGNVKDYYANPDWKWGFRVAAGYNMQHDGWDGIATYMRFNFATNNSVHQPAGGTLYSFFDESLPWFDTTYDKVSDRWSVDFNQVDIEQGRQFFVSKHLRLRPKFGLRSLWLENDQNIHAHVGNEVWKMKSRENFWGMGVLAGLDTIWSLRQGFSLYGNVGFSALFGYFNPKQTLITDAPAVRFTTGHQEVTKANMDLALGVRYDKNFYDDRYHIGFNFGFEQHIYWNMTRAYFGEQNFSNFTGVSGRDFTMSGFTMGARFDF
jgi:hypothetical protein